MKQIVEPCDLNKDIQFRRRRLFTFQGGHGWFLLFWDTVFVQIVLSESMFIYISIKIF